MPAPKLEDLQDQVPTRVKYPVRNFLLLVQVLNLIIRKQWPVTILATPDPNFIISCSSLHHDEEIRKLLGYAS